MTTKIEYLNFLDFLAGSAEITPSEHFNSFKKDVPPKPAKWGIFPIQGGLTGWDFWWEQEYNRHYQFQKRKLTRRSK